MDFDLSCSIVFYNGDATFLHKAVAIFARSTLKVRLTICDNSEKPLTDICAGKPHCEYVFNGENLGFGRAHNRCIRQTMALARYHLILNPDVAFDEGVLEKLVAYMDHHPSVGLLLPRVRDFDGVEKKLCKRLPTPLDLVARRFNILPALMRKRLARYEMLDKNYDQPFVAPFLSGCFMLLRMDALREVGLFDERFFLYMEDVDLSRRIHQRYDTLYYPEVEIRHHHERLSYHQLKYLYIHIRSAIRYFNKWGWFFDNERRRVNRAV